MGLDTKYRPAVFGEVIGQDIAVSILQSTVIRNKFNSAYLFEGPSGTGKTTIARIFAKAILCESSKEGNPCCNCESCRLFDEEKNFGYTEMDAASVGGKDDMVKLKEDAAFVSVEKKKIICLDECHDISKQGQDALLKQVEQCPDHLIYIFCTTESNKLKPALRKRCTPFQFHRVSPNLIFKRLIYVCDNEKLRYDEEALRLIASRSEGHVRDAVKLVEEASYLGDVTVENVSKISIDYTEKVFEVLANIGSNLPRAIEVSRDVMNYIPVWDFYEQMVGLLSDTSEFIYGFDDFLPKRKELLSRLRDIHGNDIMEFLSYLVTREKFVDKIGLQSDIVLIHYKFGKNHFKAKEIQESAATPEAVPIQPITEQAPSSSTSAFTHDQLMALPIVERQELLRKQRSQSHNSVLKQEDNNPKIASKWSLPKEERQGSDSSEIIGQELSPLEFSQLMVGGRGDPT